MIELTTKELCDNLRANRERIAAFQLTPGPGLDRCAYRYDFCGRPDVCCVAGATLSEEAMNAVASNGDYLYAPVYDLSKGIVFGSELEAGERHELERSLADLQSVHDSTFSAWRVEKLEQARVKLNAAIDAFLAQWDMPNV